VSLNLHDASNLASSDSFVRFRPLVSVFGFCQRDVTLNLTQPRLPLRPSRRRLDEHARHNTTSVHTAAKVLPMLPEKLSTDLTFLSLDEERLAVVVEMVVGANDGNLGAVI
jgi:exoribonuclease II